MNDRQRASSPALPSAIHSLDQDAGAIDAAFATVGEKLSLILSIFDPTIEGLSAISTKLLGDDMTSAGASLAGVVHELQTLAVLLPQDVQSLREVEAVGERATQSFGRLLNDTRLITAVTRSARIEAARLSADAWQGGGFFDQIGEQAIPAIETIKICAADHASVTKCVLEASVSLKRFATAYAPALSSLATRLKAMVPDVEAYRRDSLATTDAAARQSRKLTEALGEAIVALQGGDSTRQRIEHAVTGLRLLQDLAGSPTSRAPGLSDHAKHGLATALRRVVSAQLRATADRMAQDCLVVDRALSSVAKEVDATSALSRSVVHRESAGGGGSLTHFEQELRRSSQLIERCRDALADLDRVTEMLTGAILKFRDAATDLSDTVSTIVLIGMNASLNSSRLGDQGRVLAVIAHEIRSIAGNISAGTEQLLPAFNAMQVGARTINERGAERLDQLRALDAKVEHLLTTMHDSRIGLDNVLGALVKDSTISADASRHALTGVSALSGAVATMRQTVELLKDTDDQPLIAGNDAVQIEAFLATTLWPIYTMEEERCLHRSALAALGIDMPEAPPAAAQSAMQPADALDDFLL